MEEDELLNVKKNGTVKGLGNSNASDHPTNNYNQAGINTTIEGESSVSQIVRKVQKKTNR